MTDATDWKARYEWLVDDALRWKDMYLAVAKERDALTAAQAENEKLRAALDKAAMYARARSECYGSSPMGTYVEGHKDASSILLTQIEALIAALSPPPLAPEK